MNMGIRIWKQILLVAFAAAFAIGTGQLAYKQQIQQEIAGKVIRFHVLANSDSVADQQLKLKVRDQVGSMMQQRLLEVTDIEESREIIIDSLGEIEACALQVLKENGCEDTVSVSLAKSRFPVKAYGESVFPAGTYQALKIVIGDGQGHNWWCVMYPNLCFSGSMYEIDDQENEEKLRAVLTTEEYKQVMESKEYSIRFRFLTFLNPES